ncbi:curli-like amyloid fiber formation chaperone CsgH [Ensifer adhaerens]|uniref:curli-like amyloid fiber formation chaperone CsgH n=1 Tax=Ensifer adhaerens TaxID=106592 RepID=UPI0015680ED4|nr:curli-like amyloid fiber formation chaperone CsgH [Ensifer adhaerens]
MNGQTILGNSSDPRIKACGVRIGGQEMATLRPFIEGAADLNGSFALSIAKQSPGGSSTTSQKNRFSEGSLGDTQVVINRPGRVRITLVVTDDAGKTLCDLDQTIELSQPMTRI